MQGTVVDSGDRAAIKLEFVPSQNLFSTGKKKENKYTKIKK